MPQIIPMIKDDLLVVYKLSYLVRHPQGPGAYPYFIFKCEYSIGKKTTTPDRVLKISTAAQELSTAVPEFVKASILH